MSDNTSVSAGTMLMPPCVWVERLAAQQANDVMPRISSTLSAVGALPMRAVAYSLYYILVASFSNPYDVYAG